MIKIIVFIFFFFLFLFLPCLSLLFLPCGCSCYYVNISLFGQTCLLPDKLSQPSLVRRSCLLYPSLQGYSSWGKSLRFGALWIYLCHLLALGFQGNLWPLFLSLSFYLQSDVIAETERGAVPNPHWCQRLCLPSNRRRVLPEHSAHFLDAEHTGHNSSD